MERLQGEEYVRSRRKRSLDLASVAAAAPIWVPALGSAYTATRLSSKDGAVIRQPRLGVDEQQFDVFKLKTLSGPVDNGASEHIYEHERATRIGKVLRRYHLDELPQIANVLRGEMSVVGPRPLTHTVFDQTMDVLSPAEQAEWRQAISVARPGLVSTYARRMKASDHRHFNPRARAEADIYYAHHATFAHDLGIIAGRILIPAMRAAGGQYPQLDHVRSVDVMSQLAQHHGVLIDGRDKALLHACFRVGRVLDTNVDEYGLGDAQGMVDDLLTGKPIPGIEASEATALGDLFAAVSEQKQAQMMQGGALAQYAQQRRAAVTPEGYIQATLDEAATFAQCLALDTDPSRPDGEARQRFNDWLTYFSKVAYGLDSFVVDLGKDLTNDLVSPELSRLRARYTLGAYGLTELFRFAGVSSPRTLTVLAKGSARKLASQGLRTLLG